MSGELVMITVLGKRHIRFSLVIDDWLGRSVRLPRSYFDTASPNFNIRQLGSWLVATLAEAKLSLTLIIEGDIPALLEETAPFFSQGKCQWWPSWLAGQKQADWTSGQQLASLLIESAWRVVPHLLWKFHSGQVKFDLQHDQRSWEFRMSWHPNYHPLYSKYSPPKDLGEWE